MPRRRPQVGTVVPPLEAPLGQSAIPSAAFYLTRVNRAVPRLTMGGHAGIVPSAGAHIIRALTMGQSDPYSGWGSTASPPEDPSYDYARQAALKAAELAAGTESLAERIAGMIPPEPDPAAPLPLPPAEPMVVQTMPEAPSGPEPPLAFIPTWAKVAGLGLVFLWIGRRALMM